MTNRIRKYDGPGNSSVEALFDVFFTSHDYQHHIITLIVMHEQVVEKLGFHAQDFHDGLDVICRAIGSKIGDRQEEITDMPNVISLENQSPSELLEIHEQIHGQWQDLMHMLNSPFEEDFLDTWDDDDSLS